MARRKWIDKKSASHFTLVHRPQNDPRIHDESAPAMVLNPTELPNAHKPTASASKKLDELAAQLGSEADNIRANEGEAANYGVYFDDTEYDYMQHLREIGGGGGEAVFVESTASLNKDKKLQKQKQSLADALQEMDLGEPDDKKKEKPLLDEDILPSQNLRRITYQNQQDVPDTIAGFQPDMDPRLREALEALEDDAYVDNDEDGDGDDIFQELAKDGEELDAYEFEETYDDMDDDGWESDATERPVPAPRDGDEAPQLVAVAAGTDTTNKADSTDADAEADPNWMDGFKQFKKDQQESSGPKAAAQRKKITPDMSDMQSSIWTTTTAGGRKKKRKGALTQQSGFSMTSSSLVRTEQLTLLDARFEKMDEEYNNEDELVYGGSLNDMKSVSGFSSASSVQGPLRNDFDSIMDDFLGGYSMQGKRTIRKGRPQTGIEQLEEIRRGLGPARVSTRQK